MNTWERKRSVKFLLNFYSNLDKDGLKICTVNEHCEDGFSCKNGKCYDYYEWKTLRFCVNEYDCKPGWKCNDRRCIEPTSQQKVLQKADKLPSQSSNEPTKDISNQTKPRQATSSKPDSKIHKILPKLDIIPGESSNESGMHNSNETKSSQGTTNDAIKLFIEACSCYKSLNSSSLLSMDISSDESNDIPQNTSFCSKVRAPKYYVLNHYQPI